MSFIITIDGTAGSGKGRLAKDLARSLQLVHLDTGLLYRRIAWHIWQEKLPLHSATATKIAKKLELPIENLDALRQSEVSNIASKIATYSEVRDALLPLQRKFAQNPLPPAKGVILDGRDTGSVICPDARIKIYLEASLQVRAKRRYLELHKAVPLEEVKKNIMERDYRDKERQHAPLVVPKDAKIIDTSSHTPAQTLKICLAWLKSLEYDAALKGVPL